jgi:c-di-GMP-binding flagellar brake protein YcgR
MPAGQSAGIRQAVSVQILDISVGGLLFQVNQSVPIGARGPLRLTIDGRTFTTDVAVVRAAPVSTAADAPYQVRAQFTSMSPEHRRILERFTYQ